MFDELFHFPPDRNAQQVCPKQPKQSLGLALPSQLQAGLEIEQVYSRLICNLITFYKPFKIYLNLSYREQKSYRNREREVSSVCWYTPKMKKTAKTRAMAGNRSFFQGPQAGDWA